MVIFKEKKRQPKQRRLKPVPEWESILSDCYQEYHRPEFLGLDPLGLIRHYRLHRSESLSRVQSEFLILCAALMAFGAVEQIRKSLEWIILNHESIAHQNPEKFRHRLYTQEDLVLLYQLVQKSSQTYGSLEGHFDFYFQDEHLNVVFVLNQVIQDWKEWSLLSEMPKGGKYFFHLLSAPQNGSACKRWFMFLKWVIRPDDGIDLGFWRKIRFQPQHLVIPIDVHLLRQSTRLGLTRSKSANLRTALQVTEMLKKADPKDPTRFDFSLCRLGMVQYRSKRKSG